MGGERMQPPYPTLPFCIDCQVETVGGILTVSTGVMSLQEQGRFVQPIVLRTGAVLSITMTICVADALLLCASVAEYVNSMRKRSWKR